MKNDFLKIIGFGFLILGIWIFVQRNNQKIMNEIDQNRFETVAKVTGIKYGAKNKSAEYKFNYNGKIYSSGKALKGGEYLNIVNKYFVLHLSTKNPNRNKIYLDREVKDTLLTNGLKL